MFFRNVEHQDRALSILRRALDSGRTHHAYLLEGPDGVGKEMAGRALAARLICEGTAALDACGACRSCRLLACDNHPDFHVIERALHKKHPESRIRNQQGLELVIDVVRHFLIERASSSPALGRRRVFLIREAERMSTEAQNALLKTLEEPPGQACLILVTASATRLLATIRSRCQTIPFGLLPLTFVRDQLIQIARIDGPAAAALAGLSQGRLGAALHWHRIDLLATLRGLAESLAAGLAQSPEQFGKRFEALATELVTRTREAAKVGDAADDDSSSEADDTPSDDASETGGAKSGSKKIPTDELRTAVKLVLLTASSILRDVLVSREAGTAAPPPLSAGLVPLNRILPDASAGVLADAIHAVGDAERMLDRNVAVPLACERLAIAMTGECAVS